MPPEPPRALIGRRDEWAAVSALLEPHPAAARVLLVEGEAGVGEYACCRAMTRPPGADGGCPISRPTDNRGPLRLRGAGRPARRAGLPDLPASNGTRSRSRCAGPGRVPRLDPHAVTLATSAISAAGPARSTRPGRRSAGRVRRPRRWRPSSGAFPAIGSGCC